MPIQRDAPWLEIGLAGPLHIRREVLSTRPDACRLLYISDIHLRRGRSDRLCKQVIHAAHESGATVVLLGGDLVDSASELQHLSAMVRELLPIGEVLAVGGNHDQAIGLTQVQEAVEQAGGQWIHDQTRRIRHQTRTIAISGPEAPPQPTPTCGDTIRVLCGHNPRIWKRARSMGYDLVLAGHLHGCQGVAFKYRDRLFPGALFYPYCYLTRQHRSSRLVVSRGVSDLFPIRWRCPREVVVCDV